MEGGGGIPIFPSQHTHCKKCGVVITQRMCGYHTLSFHTWCVDTILCRTHAHTTHAECVINIQCAWHTPVSVEIMIFTMMTSYCIDTFLKRIYFLRLVCGTLVCSIVQLDLCTLKMFAHGNTDLQHSLPSSYTLDLIYISLLTTPEMKSRSVEAMKQTDEEFVIAIEGGNIQSICSFLDSRGEDHINHPVLLDGKSEMTPLMWACNAGKTESVCLLLDRGANIHLKYANEYTPLMIASIRGYVEVVKLLLQRRANVNEVSGLGLSSLHLASKAGHVEVVAVLLKHRANVELPRKDGCTALML